MPEVKPPQIEPQSTEATVANLVARGATPREIIQYVRSATASSGARATLARHKNHMSRMAKLAGEKRTREARKRRKLST